MLIMQEDLLSELHLPKLNLTSLPDVLSQNSTRLTCLKKENDYEKDSKATPPHFKGTPESMVSGLAELDLFLSIPGEHAKAAKRKFTCKKSLLRANNCLINDVRKSPSSTVKAEESNIKVNDDIKCYENGPSQEKYNSDSQTLISEESLSNKSAVSQSVVHSKVEVLSDDYRLPKVKAEVQSAADEFNQCLENFSADNCVDGKTKSPTVKVEHESSSNKIVSDVEDEAEPALCVISEVIGNANETFSRADDAEETQEKAEEIKETQLITPKKTTDITKIKGWRRKQFFVEKPTTVEYYSISKGSLKRKKRIEAMESSPVEEDPGNVENAFVCDSLDEFLDREAELKIDYEIPHLYAEFGIKLTSEDIVSRPKLSEEDIKEVGTRYCLPVTLPCDGTNLDGIKEETYKRFKRPSEEDLKPCKVLKLEEFKREPVRCEQKTPEKCKNVEVKREENFLVPETVKPIESEDLNRWNNLKLTSKFIALVVYPSPFVPLHPIVRYHLYKLRSYQTKVDKNWADFAASAVLVKDKRCKRKILPVRCCFRVDKNSADCAESAVLVNDKRCKRKILPVPCCIKTEATPTVTSGENGPEAEPYSLVSSNAESAPSQSEQFKLKKCRVVIEKLDSLKLRDPWCMEHNCYNCSACGLAKVRIEKSTPEAPPVQKETKSQSQESIETVIVSPRASFDKNVASLLAKKVRLLKYNGDTLTSIDCLKTLIPNTIEFIKLKFVKESFITGYINIWFLKPPSAAKRSRAFLTFSQTPPVPEAINLKSTAISQINLPKVITEIVSSEDSLDSNEHAILHCNGHIWEIHGSLNITFGNSDKRVEQIFTSTELPELRKLQDIAHDILSVKSVKWWILDLTQKFRLIELKSGNFNVVVSRKRFLETISLNLFGFIPLRKDSENRVLGAYIVQRLLPFVLIGPYYLLETHDMTLKGNSSNLPFLYFGEDKVTTNYPLKFFINSVIKNLKSNDRKLEGLWLYDKMFLDNTSYLEVVTTTVRTSHTAKCSSIDIDHGYSLNSLTNSSLSGATSGIVKRKDGRAELKKVTVYLYFDIFDLGFVEGELQFDNSVIINHPLDWRTKVKSHKVGDVFIGVIKGRLEFFPKDLAVRWFITKHKEDLGFRNRFNKLFLGGAHILTKSGIFYLLEMPQRKIEELGLDKTDINKCIAKCQIIREVKELKTLAGLLTNESNTPLKVEDILSKAISEVNELKKLHRIFRREKNEALARKLALASTFIKLINSSRMRFHLKIKKIQSIEHLFQQESGRLSEGFIKKLKTTRIGRKYLLRVERRENSKTKKINEILRKATEIMKKLKTSKVQSQSIAGPEESSPHENQTCTAPNVKVLNIPEDLPEVMEDAAESQENILPLESLSPVTEESGSFKFTYPRILKPTGVLKKQEERKVEKEKESPDKKTEPITDISESKPAKPDGFPKLNAPDLPDNIKIFRRNWNINKVQSAAGPEESSPHNIETCTAASVKVLNIPEVMEDHAAESQEKILPVESLSPVTEKNSSFKFTCSRILMPASILKKQEKRKVEKASPEKKTEPITDISESKPAKPDGFPKLNAPDLPDNIKIFRRNWNINKLEKLKTSKIQSQSTAGPEESSPHENQTCTPPSVKVLNVAEDLPEVTEDAAESQEDIFPLYSGSGKAPDKAPDLSDNVKIFRRNWNINKLEKLKTRKVQSTAGPEESSPRNNETCTAPSVKVLNIPEDLPEVMKDAAKSQEDILPVESLSPVTEKNSSFKFTCSRILKPVSILKKQIKRKVEKESPEKKTEPITDISESKPAKPDGFPNLTAPDLPDNVKIFWRNWNVSKLEVV